MYLAADEHVLSKDRQLYVLDRLKQKLRQGNFDGGIESAIVDIGLGLSGADMPDDTDSSWDWGLGFIGLIFGGFLCNSCWWVIETMSVPTWKLQVCAASECACALFACGQWSFCFTCML